MHSCQLPSAEPHMEREHRRKARNAPVDSLGTHCTPQGCGL